MTSLAESLKTNTSLSELDLCCLHGKTSKANKYLSIVGFMCSLKKPTGNSIGNEVATPLCEMLKSNSTLTKLSLLCESKREHNENALVVTFQSHSNLIDNNVGYQAETPLIQALKANTTLTELSGLCETQNNKKHAFIFHSCIFHSCFLFQKTLERRMKVKHLSVSS